MLHGLWDFSSSTRDGIQAVGSQSTNLTIRQTGNSLHFELPKKLKRDLWGPALICMLVNRQISSKRETRNLVSAHRLKTYMPTKQKSQIFISCASMQAIILFYFILFLNFCFDPNYMRNHSHLDSFSLKDQSLQWWEQKVWCWETGLKWKERLVRHCLHDLDYVKRFQKPSPVI